MGVPAHRNLLCLEEKRPPEREGPRERCGEGVGGGERQEVTADREEPCKDTGRGHRHGEGGTEAERPGEEGHPGRQTRGGRRGKADQARWACEFLSSVAPPQPGSPTWPPTHRPTARTSLSVVSTSVLSLERTSLTCTRIWKAGQAVSGTGGGLTFPLAPRGPDGLDSTCWAEGEGEVGSGEERVGGGPDNWVLAGARGVPQTVTQVTSMAFQYQSYFT